MELSFVHRYSTYQAPYVRGLLQPSARACSYSRVLVHLVHLHTRRPYSNLAPAPSGSHSLGVEGIELIELWLPLPPLPPVHPHRAVEEGGRPATMDANMYCT